MWDNVIFELEQRGKKISFCQLLATTLHLLFTLIFLSLMHNSVNILEHTELFFVQQWICKVICKTEMLFFFEMILSLPQFKLVHEQERCTMKKMWDFRLYCLSVFFLNLSVSAQRVQTYAENKRQGCNSLKINKNLSGGMQKKEENYYLTRKIWLSSIISASRKHWGGWIKWHCTLVIEQCMLAHACYTVRELASFVYRKHVFS